MLTLYCIVPSDLTGIQRGVQAAHGAVQYLLDHPETPWRNHALVFLKAPGLEPWAPGADATFREPYWGDRLTCCVYLGVQKDPRFQALALA